MTPVGTSDLLGVEAGVREAWGGEHGEGNLRDRPMGTSLSGVSDWPLCGHPGTS